MSSLAPRGATMGRVWVTREKRGRCTVVSRCACCLGWRGDCAEHEHNAQRHASMTVGLPLEEQPVNTEAKELPPNNVASQGFLICCTHG